MVTLIHNVLTTDYVAMIHDGDCVAGLAWVEANCAQLKGLFGISGICNILGSIRMARYLGLGPGDNVVTIATDGFDRYPSVLANFDHSSAAFQRDGSAEDILDVRPCEQKERLFAYKEEVWTKFGYSHEYLESLKSQFFWDNEYAKIGNITQ